MVKPVHFQKKWTGFFEYIPCETNCISSRIEYAVHQGVTKSIWGSACFVPKSWFLMFFFAVFRTSVFQGVTNVWLIYGIFITKIRREGPWSIQQATAHNFPHWIFSKFSQFLKKNLSTLQKYLSISTKHQFSALFSYEIIILWTKPTVSITNCLRNR